MVKHLRFDILERQYTKLPARMINTTNERRLVQEHETPPRAKGDFEDVSSEVDNGDRENGIIVEKVKEKPKAECEKETRTAFQASITAEVSACSEDGRFGCALIRPKGVLWDLDRGSEKASPVFEHPFCQPMCEWSSYPAGREMGLTRNVGSAALSRMSTHIS
ncbi:hypothetical protein TNCV_3972761 [Trichonephila clavipes]|nr:hypothetical protein TNCV_3972761 [Trichonephila clavipes]